MKKLIKLFQREQLTIWKYPSVIEDLMVVDNINRHLTTLGGSHYVVTIFRFSQLESPRQIKWVSIMDWSPFTENDVIKSILASHLSYDESEDPLISEGLKQPPELPFTVTSFDPPPVSSYGPKIHSLTDDYFGISSPIKGGMAESSFLASLSSSVVSGMPGFRRATPSPDELTVQINLRLPCTERETRLAIREAKSKIISRLIEEDEFWEIHQDNFVMDARVIVRLKR